MKNLFIVILILLASIATSNIATSKEISVEKYFDNTDGKIKINIKTSVEIMNVTIIDPIPFGFSAENISNNGILQKSGVFKFVEWNLGIERNITLSYLPEKIMEINGGISLFPLRIYLPNDSIIYGGQLNLTPRDVIRIKNKVCELDGFCAYPNENHLNCPEDCPSGGWDGKCDGITDGFCDPDCVRFLIKDNDPDCRVEDMVTAQESTTSTETTSTTTIISEKDKRGGNNHPVYYGIIITILTVIAIIFSIMKRREMMEERKDREEFENWVEEELRMGESPNELREEARKFGYSPEIVDRIMERL